MPLGWLRHAVEPPGSRTTRHYVAVRVRDGAAAPGRACVGERGPIVLAAHRLNALARARRVGVPLEDSLHVHAGNQRLVGVPVQEDGGEGDELCALGSGRDCDGADLTGL